MSYNVFEGAGLYLYNPEPAMDLHEFCRKFKAAGGTWIGFLLQEGKVIISNPKNTQLIGIARQEGLKVVGSSWLVDAPVEEARISKSLIVEHDLDGWIPNGEQPVCYSQPWGFCPDCFTYSSRWVHEWGMIRPTMFSSFTHFRNHDIDYKPWVEAGCFAGPQAYVNQWGWGYGPGPAIPSAMDVGQPHNGYLGFASNRIAPVGGIYEYIGQTVPSIREWCGQLANERALPGRAGYGFSFWPGELMRNVPNAWTDLEYSIKFRGLARYEGDGIGVKEPPLTGVQFPYTGPYYGPTTNKPKRKGNTAKALKIAMHRLGFGVFTNPDIFYNLNLEMAMRRYQAARGIAASGNYGKGTWEQIRKEILPNGQRALTPAAVALVQQEAQ